MFRRIALAVSLALMGLPCAYAAPTTIRVSVTSQPEQGNGDAGSPALSADGRYLAFVSKATNLVTGGSSGQEVFLRDNESGVVQLVSKSSTGTQGNNTSYSPSISADGRCVAFYSDATNLVTSDTNGATDVFMRDVQAGTTTRVSISSSGSQASGVSTECSISADGRYVAFVSYATNLVTGDTNGARDVFVRDVQAGNTTRVSVSTSGTQADSASYFPSISADGRYVAFASIATNLVSGDTNGYQDVYVRDRNTNVTTRVSVTSGGLQGNGPSGEYGLSSSPDGRYIAFASYATNLVTGDTNLSCDIFVRDQVSGLTSRASITETGAQTLADSFWPTISSGGAVVAFQSTSANLVSGDTNAMTDAFVRDTATGTTKRISVASSGTQANGGSYYPMVSADGLHVAYQSYASNLVTGDTNSYSDVFLHNLGAGITSQGSVADAQAHGQGQNPSVSFDGRFIAFESSATNLVPTDLNGARDVFIRDTTTVKTALVSISTGGIQGDSNSYSPSASADGRYVAFVSYATNLVTGDTNGARDVFVRDVQACTTTRVSVSTSGTQANDSSENPSISADGRYVAYDSNATNLVTGDTNGARDVFVRDVQAGTTTRVSVTGSGSQASGWSTESSISADGRYVAFVSNATNLVTGDTNGARDVFVRDVQAGTTTRVSLASDGTEANGFSWSPFISADGRFVVFASDATNLVPGDTNNDDDIFVRDITAGTTVRISLSLEGLSANGDSILPSISSDGRYVAFRSNATNLVPGDTNGVIDTFVRNLAAGMTSRVSVSADGLQSNAYSDNPCISGDARFIAFDSTATNLVADDSNSNEDVFLRGPLFGDSPTAVALQYVTQPGGAPTGQPLAPQPVVRAVDSGGSTVTDYTGEVTLSIKSGTGTSDALLSGTTTVTCVSGIATFTNLTIDKAGTGYVLTATSAGLTSADSVAFNITQVATNLAFSVQPDNATESIPFGTQPIVTAKYPNGTTATDYTGAVTISIKSGTGTPGAILSGTKTVNCVSGVATFTSLAIDKPGTGYVLTATSPGLTSADSAAFVVTVATATVSGTPYAWGDNGFGQIGDSTTANHSVPFALSGLSNVATMSGGDYDSFALKSDGTVLAWGQNGYGQLGDGTTSDRSVPVEVTSLTNVAVVRAGYHHSLAVKTDGSVWAWGQNNYGQLGDGTKVNRTAPVPVSGLTNVTAVSVGYDFSVALTADGTVWAWGNNYYGQLGDGTNTNSNVPVLVSGLTEVTAVSSGHWHSLALRTDGSVWAWGYNDGGQLGDGSVTGRNTPVRVDGLTGVVAASCGHWHNLAIKTDGSVWAWGANANGQLGDGTTTYSLLPLLTLGLENIAEVSAGGAHSLAIRTDGAVFAWGANSSGQLGIGTTLDRSVPVRVTGLTNVSDISAGGYHSLALANAYLTFQTQPQGGTAGEPLVTQPIIEVRFSDGTMATSFTGQVTISIKAGTGNSGATLSGTKIVNCVSGVATFTNLAIDKPGTGYVLTATSPGLTSADSAPFTVAQVAKALAFSVEPGNAKEGTAFGTQPVVIAKYGDGTTATDYTGAITLAIKSGTGAAGAILSGTKTVNCVAGVATFTDLSIDKAGEGYVLVATSLGLTSAESEPFTVAESVAVVRVSVSSEEVQANGASTVGLGVSQDGRWVTFLSSADNLVAGDTNAVADVFLRDTFMGTTQRVSVSSEGIQANAASADGMDVSDGGRFVSFVSYADNLGGDDTNGVRDVFLHDTWTGRTECASVGLDGQPSNGESRWTNLSADGRYLAFYSNATNIVSGVLTAVNHCYVRDMSSGTTTLVDVTPEGVPGNQRGYGPVLSEDGRYVLFVSDATDLVADDTNNVGDVFVRDLATGVTTLVSRSTAGIIGNGYSGDFGATISADGTKVAFASIANNLVAADTNSFRDIFIRDLTTGVTTRASVGAGGVQANNWSGSPTLSRDGGKVSFYSHASNLVDDDTNGLRDAFVRDAATGTTTLVNRAPDGTLGNGAAYWSRLSGDGRYVTFFSEATNLVPGDTNGVSDLFIAGLLDYAVVFAIQPESGIPGGPLEPQPVVHVRNINGELLSTFTGDVTLSIKPGSGTQGAVLDGTTTVTAIGGVATFTNLAINLAGSGYVLVAAVDGLSNAESAAFDIRPQASHLVFFVQPGDAKEGYAFGIQPVVVARYPDGTTATDYTGPVTLAIKPGTGTAGAILGGTTTVNCIAGVATFTNLSIDTAGTGYVLIASGIGLADGESAAFDVSQRATTLAFSVQPGNAREGRPFGTQSVVVARYGNGTTATDYTGAVTLSIKSGTGAPGATLDGSTTVICVAGVATFTGISIDKAGADYVLTASSSGLESTNSIPITVIGNDTVWAWGGNWCGQLGDGTTTDRPYPGTVREFANLLQMSAGAGHNLALADDHTVWAWGSNGSGSFGFETTPWYSTVPIESPGLTNILQVSAGSDYSLYLKSDGSVWACGENRNGQLGDGTTTDYFYPVQVSGLSAVSSVSAGIGTSLAVKNDGSVWAWGRNNYGQLGDGTITDRHLPVQVLGLNNVVSVSSVCDHGLAMKSDGSVWSWGRNDAGQLGDGTTQNRLQPVRVSGLFDARSIVAGNFHSVALRKDGSVWAWGLNDWCQLGDGTTDNRSVPVRVSSLDGIIKLAGGQCHTLALKEDGSVWAWGWNYSGQLGDGTNIQRCIPVRLNSLSGIQSISAGGDHCLAYQTSAVCGFVTQPGEAREGFIFGKQPVVVVVKGDGTIATDYNGTITLSIKSNTGSSGATLGGTTEVIAVSGVATFTNLAIDKAGSGYVVSASGPGLASYDSLPFDVIHVVSSLSFTVAPSYEREGLIFGTQPIITAKYRDGTIAIDYTGDVNICIKPGSGPEGAILDGVRTVKCSSGIATYGDLSIDRAGNDYILVSTSGSLPSVECQPFIVYRMPAQLVFSTQPGGAIQATRFSGQPVLIARDGNGAFIPDFNGPVVLAIKPGTGAPGAVLSGTTTAVAVNGVATFTDLSIDRKGTGYVLQASVGGIVLGESAPFNVTPKAERLVFTTQPGAATDDWPFGIQPVVTVQDADGDTATLFTGSITVDIKSGTGAVGAVLTGTRTITAPQGMATFTDLGISELGSGYVLAATASGLISGDSTPFDVTEAPKLVPAQVSADIVEISVHPAGQTITGTWITLSWDENDLNRVSASDVTPAEGWTLDSFDASSGLTLALSRAEGVTSNGPVVSIRLTAKPGVSGRTIPVTLTGESYLTDSTFNNTPVKSRTIAFIPGAQMAFTQQPVATTAGYAIAGQPTVAMLDGTRTVVVDYVEPMTVVLKPGTGTEGAVLDGTTTLTPASGVVVFTDLTIDRKGTGYVLTATSGPFAVESIPFDIAPRALKLAFTAQPGTTRAGLPLTPYPAVTVQDEEGSTAFTYSGVITLAIKPGTGYPGVTLGGMTTVNAVSGIATFNNVNIGTASPGYVLVATGQSLTGAESNAFDITAFTFTLPDVRDALRWSAGLSTMPPGYLNRFDVVTNGSITLGDAVRISRKVVGLEGNP